MKVLVTGGAGYIGSTIASALEDSGHTPILLDSLTRGHAEFVRGRAFYQGDIADKALLEKVFQDHPEIQACVHCAALILVPESVAQPYLYYTENVAKSLELFKNLNALGCNRVVFSSSASIYEISDGSQVTEDSRVNAKSPYARTKQIMEMVLEDFSEAYGLNAIVLRYFNPIGADPKMRSGMQIKEVSHIVPKLVEVAMGREAVFKVHGTQYPTRDGTAVRDYLHIWDLAMAHVKAVEEFDNALAKHRVNTGDSSLGFLIINLGTGKGVTVRELVAAFERVYGKPVPTEDHPPRPGDVAGVYANPDRALALIGWKVKHSIDEGIATSLEWGKRRKDMLGY
jgi:UDP-glucose 4-epimerase